MRGRNGSVRPPATPARPSPRPPRQPVMLAARHGVALARRSASGSASSHAGVIDSRRENVVAHDLTRLRRRRASGPTGGRAEDCRAHASDRGCRKDMQNRGPSNAHDDLRRRSQVDRDVRHRLFEPGQAMHRGSTGEYLVRGATDPRAHCSAQPTRLRGARIGPDSVGTLDSGRPSEKPRTPLRRHVAIALRCRARPSVVAVPCALHGRAALGRDCLGSCSSSRTRTGRECLVGRFERGDSLLTRNCGERV